MHGQREGGKESHGNNRKGDEVVESWNFFLCLAKWTYAAKVFTVLLSNRTFVIIDKLAGTEISSSPSVSAPHFFLSCVISCAHMKPEEVKLDFSFSSSFHSLLSPTLHELVWKKGPLSTSPCSKKVVVGNWKIRTSSLNRQKWKGS